VVFKITSLASSKLEQMAAACDLAAAAPCIRLAHPAVAARRNSASASRCGYSQQKARRVQPAGLFISEAAEKGDFQMLHQLTNGSYYPQTADIASVTFKQLAHQATYMTPSGKAGLAGQLVRGEIKAVKPTRLIAMTATGASASNLARALKVTPAERVALIAEQITLGELTTMVGNESSLPDMTAMPTAKPRFTVEEMLTAYRELTPAERVKFSREIGVVRCWQPQQRYYNVEMR
jgi:hypothetical protein